MSLQAREVKNGFRTQTTRRRRRTHDLVIASYQGMSTVAHAVASFGHEDVRAPFAARSSSDPWEHGETLLPRSELACQRQRPPNGWPKVRAGCHSVLGTLYAPRVWHPTKGPLGRTKLSPRKERLVSQMFPNLPATACAMYCSTTTPQTGPSCRGRGMSRGPSTVSARLAETAKQTV